MPEQRKEHQGIELDPCPFCGGKLGATVDEKGEVDGIVHSMPFCKKFEQLSPEEFVHECAVKLGANN